MAYVNSTLFYIIIVVLILAFFLLILVAKKVKHGWLYFFAVFLLLIIGFFIQKQIAYLPFSNLSKELCIAHPEIEDVSLDLINRGQICRIRVYLPDDADDQTVERIFIDIMKKVNKEPVSSYLKGTADYDWLNVQVFFGGGSRQRFNSEQYQRSEWFTKENQVVQTWKNDITHKTYFYKDYVE